MSIALAVVLIKVELEAWMVVVLTAALVFNVVLFFVLLFLKRRIDRQSN